MKTAKKSSASCRPARLLKPNVIEVFIRWIMNGMPQTAAEAGALSPTPVP
jgi:hypothetical protein